MTPEERAFADGVRSAAMKLCSKFMACETEIEGNPRLAIQIAKNGARDALALCNKAATRLGAADLAEDNAAVMDSDYDLNALSTAAPSRVKE